MEITKNDVLNYLNKCNDLEELVMYLELTAHKSGVKTISAQSRKDGKSPNGIRTSKNYRKVVIGEQLMCVKGLRDKDLPF